MLISYKWLQSYFEKKLPAPEKLVELITFSFAEVESFEKKGEDTILDIKVLPDRACYALSHRGVSYEVSAIIGLERKIFKWPQPIVSKVRSLNVCIEKPELCSRYMARVIENIDPKAQVWVREHLEAIGQRSISPIVDGANIVMFDMGQPLHAFDADKVEGDIVVRLAKKGEKIITLDNRDVTLDEETLIIADEKGPLAIAGIKGGKKAEVSSSTKNLILESANFNASHIRKTAERLGIKTDASKRFENHISPELASTGMDDFTAYLFEIDKNIKVGEIIDIYPKKQEERTIIISEEYISNKLGLKISSEQIKEVLSRLLIEFAEEAERKELVLIPPPFRIDLNIPEDIAEEIGRIVGYDKIPITSLPKINTFPKITKSFYYEWKIREILVNAGFSEVMTSSFTERGEVEIEKPLAEDKKYTRPDLRINFEKVLAMNTLNTPLFDNNKVKIFEIGKVFTKSGEHLSLAISENNDTIAFIGENKKGVSEYNLDEIIKKLPEPKNWDISISDIEDKKFKPFSLYPFIVRDIALFVPVNIKPEEVIKVIKEIKTELILKEPTLFDDFTNKEGKRSLAFRMIFQSMNKTLSDSEVNEIMKKIYDKIKEKGWEVR
ncbi:MAG: phenylalanine--tRNA ligase subunit beta [Patescibacteria group bacterium]